MNTTVVNESIALDSALLDHYRCPGEYGQFAVAGDLAANEGYFRFGTDVICYGRSSLGQSSDIQGSAQFDALQFAQSGDFALPFSPSEVAANLRCERYVQTAPPSLWGTVRRKAYYGIRPLLGVGVRKYLQRVALRDWETLTFPNWPVDRTVDRMFERLLALSMKNRGVEAIPFVWFWPDRTNSCLIMTHDVEERAGLDMCGNLMDLDSAFGLKASFQLVPEKRYSVPRDLLDSVRDRGFEVNVHDLNHDGHLYDERGEFDRRTQKINEYATAFGATGFRAGMLYRNQDWFDSFQFSYDMSVPNVAHLDPQRGGCCTLMPYFIGDVLEIPLTTTQDYSLFHILQSYDIDLWKVQVEKIIQHHSLVSFNIHPDYIVDDRALKTYRALLGYLADLCSQEKLTMYLPQQVDQWWRDRSRMKVVDKNGEWVIEGPNSERATLAWARLSGDGIEYDFGR